MLELEGKVAIVTGAGRGIGRAIAQGFAKAGAKVCCSARTESEIRASVTTINEAGGSAFALASDVTDPTSLQALFDATQRRFGGVDIVVANAARGSDRHAVDGSDPAVWEAIINTNLMGAYHTARTAIPYLKNSPSGKIIFVGSGGGHRAVPNASAYACSKAALWMFVRTLAQELSSTNICVNELIPGPVDTDMLRAGLGGGQIRAIEWVKQPDDVVPLAIFIASQPARGPTGQSYSLARREL